MPSPDSVRFGLGAIAIHWYWLAVAWHVLLACWALILLTGRRPSMRAAVWSLIAPLLSVGSVAWLSGNPFNGTAFTLLSAALATIAWQLPVAPIRIASPARVGGGVALVLFGWTYPHFFTSNSLAAYLYQSPLGTLPCPTLAAVIGFTLIARNLGSTPWSTALVTAGLFYGLVGVFVLHVALDLGLVLGAALLGTMAVWDAHGWRSIRAEPRERTCSMPSDALIAEPSGTLTHGITIASSPQAVWPWLVQMGAGSRAGWYSYDRLDNGGVPSATRVLPQLQHIAIGTVFPALPGVSDGFTVLAFEAFRSLVLGWRDSSGTLLVTWAFVLDEGNSGSTRLLVRVRAARGYRFHGLPEWLSGPIIRIVHFVMQRKQLLGIAQRVESSATSAIDASVLAAREGQTI